jgi:hypothetical protein
MWICLLWVSLLGDVNLWCMSYVNMWCYINSHTCLTKFLKNRFFYLIFMIYYTSSRVVLYLATLLVLRPTQAHSRLISREGRLPHAVSSHSPLALPPLSPPRLCPPHLANAATHATPLRWDTRHTTLSAMRTTPLTARSGGGGTQQWRRRRRWLEEGYNNDDDD